MRPADIVLVKVKKDDTMLDDAIAEMTNSQYYHAAGFILPGVLVEAQGMQRTGLQLFEQYAGHCDIFTCPDMTDEQAGAIVAFVKSKIGSRYDYSLIVWEFLRYAAHVNLPFDERGRFICSTLWSQAYQAAGIELCPGVRYPTPADIGASEKLIRQFETNYSTTRQMVV